MDKRMDGQTSLHNLLGGGNYNKKYVDKQPDLYLEGIYYAELTNQFENMN